MPTDQRQLARSELAAMSPERIEEARLAGRLDDLLTGVDVTAEPCPPLIGSADQGVRGKAEDFRQLTRGDLRAMTAEQIDDAHETGLLDDLLRFSR